MEAEKNELLVSMCVLCYFLYTVSSNESEVKQRKERNLFFRIAKAR
jgi:hypothetical protein